MHPATHFPKLVTLLLLARRSDSNIDDVSQLGEKLSDTDVNALRAGLEIVIGDEQAFDALFKIFLTFTGECDESDPVLDERLKQQILDHGLEGVRSDQLVALATTPIWLAELRDAVIEFRPWYWTAQQPQSSPTRMRPRRPAIYWTIVTAIAALLLMIGAGVVHRLKPAPVSMPGPPSSNTQDPIGQPPVQEDIYPEGRIVIYRDGPAGGLQGSPGKSRVDVIGGDRLSVKKSFPSPTFAMICIGRRGQSETVWEAILDTQPTSQRTFEAEHRFREDQAGRWVVVIVELRQPLPFEKTKRFLPQLQADSAAGDLPAYEYTMGKAYPVVTLSQPGLPEKILNVWKKLEEQPDVVGIKVAEFPVRAGR